MPAPEGQIDVNNAPDPSSGQGVPADPPPAQPDVKSSLLPPASSPEGTPPAGEPPAKPHEDSVPYERFSEVNEKNKELQAQLDAALQAATQSPAPPPDDGNGQVDWNALGLAPDAPPQQADPGQQPVSGQILPEEVEQQIRDGIYSRPYATMAPIIQELARQVIRQEKQQESQARRMPGFQEYESTYYNIPDEVVVQAQANPEVVRFLIAKHEATLRGTPPPPVPPSLQTPSPAQTAPPAQAPPAAAPAQSMEELKLQWKAEGEREALNKLRNQAGMTSEPATTVTTPPTDAPELDEQGKAFMRNLGIPQDKFGKVAERLQRG